MSETYENCPSESSRYKELTRVFCYRADGLPGCGVDIASQGDPVVPWAMQLDLPPQEFAYYNSNHLPRGPIQLTGWAQDLPFESNSLDFVFSSHLLEDFLEEKWPAILGEWSRCVKPGGHLIILIPDKTLWAEALAKGQPPNCAHKREGEVGLMSKYVIPLGFEVIKDELTNLFPGDYTILGVFKKSSANGMRDGTFSQRGVLEDLTGLTFGRLRVVSFACRLKRNRGTRILWLCQCECGRACSVSADKLRSGHTQSCGCLQKEKASTAQTKHGGTRSRVYGTWRGMMERCFNTQHLNYHNYGERGIKVCIRWLNFKNFREDMESTFQDGLTLDRKDVNGNYEPGNCKWSTVLEQANNRRKKARPMFFSYCL